MPVILSKQIVDPYEATLYTFAQLNEAIFAQIIDP